MTWLNDPIFTIREAAVENLKQLTILFGHQWASRQVIPKLLALHKDANYLHRLTPLFGIAALGEVVNHEIINR